MRDPKVAARGHRPVGERGELGHDLGGDRGRRQAGDAAHLDLDRRAVGDDVDGGAAANDPGLECRMRRAEALVERPLGREPGREVADEEQELRRRIERVLAERRVRGMAGSPLDDELQRLLALVRQDRPHLGRLADDAARRRAQSEGRRSIR